MTIDDVEDLRFQVGAELLTAQQIEERARRAAPKVSRRSLQPTKFHKGWRVVGHSRDALESAERDAREQFAKDTARLEAGKGGAPAKPWDEHLWRMNTKKTPVRARPFEVREAAQELAALAQRQGWTDVEIIELKKGEA